MQPNAHPTFDNIARTMEMNDRRQIEPLRTCPSISKRLNPWELKDGNININNNRGDGFANGMISRAKKWVSSLQSCVSSSQVR